MLILRQIGNQTNTSTNEYIVDTQKELEELAEEAPFGSIAILLVDSEDSDGALCYIMNSEKKWILIK